MMRALSVSHIVIWSAGAILSFCGCGATGADTTGSAGRTGTGGLGQAGSDGVGGSTGAGGSAGATGTGIGGSATGGQGGSGGSAAGGAGAGGAGATGTGGRAAGGDTGMSAGCGKAPTIPSGEYNNGHHIAITAANMQREYILNVPASYDNTHPYRLVIAYHELNGNDDEMYRNNYYHLLPLSNDSAISLPPTGSKITPTARKRGDADGLTRTIRTWRSPMPSWRRSSRISASTRTGSSRLAGASGEACPTRPRVKDPLAGRRTASSVPSPSTPALS